MRAAWTLLAPLLVAGCMLPFCGETVYHLSGVTASTSFREPWDAASAAAGLRAAGFEPRNATERVVDGRLGNVTIYANGDASGTRVSVGFPASAQGARDEVERAGDASIAEHTAEAERILAAFARGSGWARDGEIAWDKGMLHGDC